MKQCSDKAYAACYRPCHSREEAFFLPGSHCDLFNQQVNKPMTNADRIRSMTDRELADFFYGIRECSVCAYNYEDRCVRCSDGIFKWLQKPAETPKEDG